jgi:putative membrane protein insertion efficiency factor
VRVIARLLIALVRAYQLTISPLIGPVCRFEPSCSRYAVACLKTHGAWRGLLLSVVRLAKCHPFHPGGHDPPPLPSASPGASCEASRSGAP